MIIETLQHCRLFNELDDKQLEVLAELVEEHHFHKGDYVCKEGAWGDSMYIVDAGEVKIIKKLDVEDTWEITVLRHGDFFGDVALIDGSTRTASAVALTHTTVLELYSRDFKKLISSCNDMSMRLYESLVKVLINRLRSTDDLVARIMADMKPGRAKEAATMRDAITRMIIGR
jgi:CRP/FNR family transcriptional regulator, cyclic AMP receptor protein